MEEMKTPWAAFEPSLGEAVRKIFEGCVELTAWALPRLPIQKLGATASRKLMGMLQSLRAQAEVDGLREVAAHPKQPVAEAEPHRPLPTPHPDETSVHLGPHHVDHQPVPGGIRVHPAPVVHPVGASHLRPTLRHH